MSVNYREPQWLLPNEKNLQYPAAGATQGSGLTADRHSLYSMDFDGASDYISTGLDLDSYNSFSISAWVKADTLASNKMVCAQYRKGSSFSNSSWVLYIEAPGGTPYMTFYIFSGGSAILAGKNTVLSTGQWYHIAATWDGSTSKLYINGVKETTEGTVSSMNSTIVNTLIGASSDSAGTGTTGFWDGKIDEVAIFPRALSSSEITTLYNSGSPSNPMLLSGKPEAYYPLGEQARKPGTAEWRLPNEVLQSQTIDFDGIDDYIDIGNLQPSTTSLSISAWAYKPDTTNGSIIGNGPSIDYGIFVYGGTLQFGLNTGGVWTTTATTLPTNQWFHVLATWDGATMKLYVNGTLANSTSKTGTITDSINTTTIGKNSTLSGFEWNGKISNVALWGSDQSANITNIYNYGAPQTSYTVTPTAWYKLDKTSEYAGLNPNWHSALSFNGSSNYVNLGSIDETEGITTMSISGWFKPASSGVAGASGIVAKESRDWYVGWYSSPANSIRFLISDDDGVTNDSLNSLTLGSDAEVLDKWQHFVCTWDASDKLKIYINGILSSEASSTNAVSSLPASTNSVELGRRVTTYFDGQISNLAIYNQVISPEDVKYLYNGGTPQTNISFEPLSWYKLNNTGTGIQDSGSASNNGTNNGASPVTDSVAVDQWNFDNVVQSQTPNWSSALSFDGYASSDAITLGNTIGNGFTQITCSIWVKLSTAELANTSYYRNFLVKFSSGPGPAPFELRGNHSRGDSYDNKLFFRVNTDTGSYGFTDAGFALSEANRWYHIVGTYDGSNVKTFVDGVEKTSISANGTLISNSNNATIGFSTGTGGFDGEMSNAAIFNTALDLNAIKALYNNGQPEAAISSSPVSWWKLDNTTTGIQDSVGSNNGTNNGATEIQTNVWTPRLNGESSTLPSSALTSSDLQFNSAYSSFSLDFDGTNDYVDCTDSDTFTFGNGTTDTPFSLSGWVNADSMNKFKMIAKMDATDFEYQFGTNATGKLSFTLYSLNTSNRIQRSYNSTAVSGVWQHWVATYDGSASVSGLKIYINGVRVDDTTATVGSYTAMQNTTSTLKLATTTLSNYANGKMDELAVFNKELNQAEITSIYNNGYPKDITALAPISWWRLGEDAYFDGTDFTIPNKISGAPNGTSDNMAATALVADAPGSYAAGLGSSLALADRVGDAALSTANSLSFNMIPSNRISYPAGYVPTQVDNVYSMAFDGASDYIDCGDLTFLNSISAFSTSAWFKCTDVSTAPIILNGGTSATDRCYLQLLASGTTIRYVSAGDIEDVTVSNIADGNWHNVATVHNGTSLDIYLDGVKQNSSTLTTTAPTSSIGSNFFIGRYSLSSSNYFNGNIDELAIFDYALSARQIKQDIYNGTTTGKTADLNNISNLTAPVAWYRMGD